MIFGQGLSQLRHKKGQRQKTLASRLGINASVLSRIESGRKPPPRSDQFIEKISNELGLDAEEKAYLIKCAKTERQIGRFAMGANADQLNLALQFVENLKCLSRDKILAIGAILAISEA